MDSFSLLGCLRFIVCGCFTSWLVIVELAEQLKFWETSLVQVLIPLDYFLVELIYFHLGTSWIFSLLWSLRFSGSPLFVFGLLCFWVIFAMTSINAKAQQTVIDALCMDHKNLRKTVLCHTPSELRAETGIFLSTQDRLVELFTSEMESTIAVFPNMSVVRRLCKQSLYEKFSVELVFAVNSYSDPCMLALDIMNKFRTELGFVVKATYLTDLPPGTFRQKQAFIAYIVTVTNEQVEAFDLYWECKAGERFEALLPKTIVELPEIKELLGEKGGPLSRKSTKKNGCVEVSSSGNSLPLTFTSDSRDRGNLRKAFSRFISQLHEHCGDLPASVIQVKSGVDWKAARRTERSVLFLQSFDDAQILDLAVHLTLCKIDFYFSSPRVIVLDLNGASSATGFSNMLKSPSPRQ